MQVIDEKKRLKILDAAAELFATQPFHKVLLSDVAETAGVGKGTLYIYFKNKDDLYLSALYSGFNQLIDQLRRKIDHDKCSAIQNLETVVRELVGFAYHNPHMFELMRSVTWRQVNADAKWVNQRIELQQIVESIICSGMETGEFTDPHPDLTAKFILSLVRSVMIEGPECVDRRILEDHVLHFARSALLVTQKP